MNKIPFRIKNLMYFIAGLSFSMVVFGFTSILIHSSEIPPQTNLGSEFFSSLRAITYIIIAVLIIKQQPKNFVGWLFFFIGFCSALAIFLLGLFPLIKSESLFQLMGWLSHIIWIPIFLIPITLVLQYFPDGKLPSKNWWPVPLLTLLSIIGMVSSIAFHPWPWEDQDIFNLVNPFGIPGSERIFEVLLIISIQSFALSLLGSLAALTFRFRRSRGIERIQMKWLVYTAIVSISFLLFPFKLIGINITDQILQALPMILATAIGIAIVRHRLFDIDVIIRRTLQYALLTGLLALVYFGSVISLQYLTENLFGEKSPFIIVISTLAIAALFNPLRHRIQDFIDRRFYRKKYDTEQALAQFADSSRDEIKMEKLAAALLDVLNETVQPEHISLWLKE